MIVRFVFFCLFLLSVFSLFSQVRGNSIFEDGEKYFQAKAYEKAKKIGFKIVEENTNSIVGNLLLTKVYARDFQKDSCYLWLNKVKALLPNNPNPRYQFETLLWEGFNFEVNKDYDKALGNYLEAEKKANVINDPYYIDFLYQRIMLIYSENQYKREVQQWIWKYSQKVDSINSERYRNSFFNALGKHYFYNGTTDSALLNFNKSIGLSLKLEDDDMLNNVYWHKAIIFAELKGQQDSARYYYQLSHQLCDCPASDLFQATYKYNIAVTYSHESDFSKAKKWYHKTLVNVPKARELHIRNNVYKKLYQLYVELGTKDSALYYLQLHKKFQDSLGILDRDKKLAELQTKYEVSQKEKQILEERQKVRANRNWLIAASLALFLGAGIAILLQKNTTKKRLLAEQEVLLKQQRVENLLKEQELVSIDAMIAGQEKERQKVAGELHDNLGSLMATIKLHFNNAIVGKKDPALQNAENLLEEAYQKIRSMAHSKNSGVMSDQGLLPAIKKMAQNITETDALKVTVEDFGLGERMENSLELTLFRIIQELTTNIIKHAEATKATIQLTQHEDNLNIIIEDNGRGFEMAKVEKTNSGMGLTTIEKRVEHLGGAFTVDSILDKGTSILIDIPV